MVNVASQLHKTQTAPNKIKKENAHHAELSTISKVEAAFQQAKIHSVNQVHVSAEQEDACNAKVDIS